MYYLLPLVLIATRNNLVLLQRLELLAAADGVVKAASRPRSKKETIQRHHMRKENYYFLVLFFFSFSAGTNRVWNTSMLPILKIHRNCLLLISYILAYVFIKYLFISLHIVEAAPIYNYSSLLHTDKCYLFLPKRAILN